MNDKGHHTSSCKVFWRKGKEKQKERKRVGKNHKEIK